MVGRAGKEIRSFVCSGSLIEIKTGLKVLGAEWCRFCGVVHIIVEWFTVWIYIVSVGERDSEECVRALGLLAF